MKKKKNKKSCSSLVSLEKQSVSGCTGTQQVKQVWQQRVLIPHSVGHTTREANITVTTINPNVITDCTAYPGITVSNQTKKKKKREQTADLSVTVTTINHNDMINISNSNWRVDVKHQPTTERRSEELITVTDHYVRLRMCWHYLTTMVSETEGKGTVHSTM